MNLDKVEGNKKSGRNVLAIVAVAIVFASCMYLAWIIANRSASDSASIRISPETTYITEPLTEDGLIDYRIYLNQKNSEGVTPETNAAIDYWKAIGNGKEVCDDSTYFDRLKDELNSDPFEEGGPYLVPLYLFIEQKQAEGLADADDKINKEFEAAMQGPWRREDLPLMLEWLELNEQPLEHVLAGTRKPHCYRPLINPGDSEGLFDYFLPDAQLARSMAQLLRLRAFRSLQAGEAEVALRDLLAIHRLARHTAQGPTSIEVMVGGAIEVMGSDADQRLVDSGQATSEQLRVYGTELAALSPLTDLQRVINGERMMCLDALQRLPTDPDATAVSMTDLNDALREANDIYDELEASLKKRGFDSAKRVFHRNIRSLEEKLVDVNSRTESLWSFFFGKRNASKASTTTAIYLFLPYPEGSFERGGFGGETSYRLSVLGIAVAAYQKAEGRLPESLGVLVPEYLAELSNDPYTGKPFVYRLDDEGALIYSLGKNLTDDGGKSIDEDEENFDYVFRVKRMGSK